MNAKKFLVKTTFNFFLSETIRWRQYFCTPHHKYNGRWKKKLFLKQEQVPKFLVSTGIPQTSIFLALDLESHFWVQKTLSLSLKTFLKEIYFKNLMLSKSFNWWIKQTILARTEYGHHFTFLYLIRNHREFSRFLIS